MRCAVCWISARRVPKEWLIVTFTVLWVCNVGNVARSFEILGTGTGALLGGDLTDPEDDGDPGK